MTDLDTIYARRSALISDAPTCAEFWDNSGSWAAALFSLPATATPADEADMAERCIDAEAAVCAIRQALWEEEGALLALSDLYDDEEDAAADAAAAELLERHTGAARDALEDHVWRIQRGIVGPY